MIRALLASLLTLGLLAGNTTRAADETYTLKLYQSKKGDKTDNEKRDDGKTNVVFSLGGQIKEDEETKGKKDVYTEEILEKKASAKLATKLTRTYTTAEKTEKGKTTKAVYAGETVLIEKKGDKYEFSIKGKALTEDEAPDLFNSFNKKKEDEPQNQDLLPKDPVKVGGSWKIPADVSEKLFKSFGEDKMKIDVKKSAVGGKLLKAYKKDGAQFGVIELTITVSVAELDLGGQFFKTSADSKVILKAVIDTCIDGTTDGEDSKMDVTLDIVAELPNNGSLTIKGTTKGTEKSHTKK